MDAAILTKSETPESSMRDALAECAGGVFVVTVGSGDERHGLTVTSMTSVSLKPPTLLVCINRQSSAFPVLERTRCFAVNVLTARQSRIADQFAGRFDQRGAERFEGVECRTLWTGAPILCDAVTAFDCEVDQIIEKHSHYVVFGRVCASVTPSPGSNPLLYWRRNYRELNHPNPLLTEV